MTDEPLYKQVADDLRDVNPVQSGVGRHAYATDGAEMARRVGLHWETMTDRERSYYDMLADVNRRMLQR